MYFYSKNDLSSAISGYRNGKPFYSNKFKSGFLSSKRETALKLNSISERMYGKDGTRIGCVKFKTINKHKAAIKNKVRRKEKQDYIKCDICDYPFARQRNTIEIVEIKYNVDSIVELVCRVPVIYCPMCDMNYTQGDTAEEIRERAVNRFMEKIECL